MLAAGMRIVRAFDAADDPHETAFRRLALAVTKYWVCKREAPTVAEALECLPARGQVFLGHTGFRCGKERLDP